jgi:hypothetical protein
MQTVKNKQFIERDRLQVCEDVVLECNKYF